MDGDVITVCCVCRKVLKLNGETDGEWRNDDGSINVKFRPTLKNANVSHTYCKPCMSSELDRQGIGYASE